MIESTYSDRLHENRLTRRQRLQQLVERALADNGTVLIPAFSIGRTQELLYELEDIIHRHGAAGNGAGASQPGVADWARLPIILDSPLASRFTEVYRQLQPFWDKEALQRLRKGRNPFAFEPLITVDAHADHVAMVNHLAQTARPAIVIAGGGMCNGGRIVNYLKAMLGDPRHNVLFVGYQARGTPGHAIQSYGPKGGYVDLDGERVHIKAGIDSLGGYSAHADQKGLIGFVTGMREWPRQIRIVHGEAQAKQVLATHVRRRYEEKYRQVQIIVSGVGVP